MQHQLFKSTAWRSHCRHERQTQTGKRITSAHSRPVPACCCQANAGPTENYEEARCTSRRQLMLSTTAAVAIAVLNQRPAQAFGYDAKNLKKRKVSVDEYTVREDGTRFYDLKPGTGQTVGKDDQVTVHFDCMYKGIDVVSTRSARLLGGNRTVAEGASAMLGEAIRTVCMQLDTFKHHVQPFEFTAAEKVQEQKAKVTDSAGGLFSGAGGPKPPPAISSAVLGMKPGGKRSIIVPPELGYGSKGLQEIPPNATFELVVEILSVKKA